MANNNNRDWANASKTRPNFNAEKLNPDPVVGASYMDGSDSYANLRGMYISFEHVASKSVVSFKAFITAYNENYISSWNSEEVFGRADPIHMFKNTQRKITLAFNIPAAAESEAFENLGRVQKLVQFLYPNYTTLIDPRTGRPDAYGQTISQSPLVRMKVLNLGQSHRNLRDFTAAAGADAPYPFQKYGELQKKGEYESGGASTPQIGILGAIDNLTVNHNLESQDGVFEEGYGTILPKFIDINMSFSAIHEHTVGWLDDPASEGESKFAAPNFPYSVNMEESLPGPRVTFPPAPISTRWSSRAVAVTAQIPTVPTEVVIGLPDAPNAGAADDDAGEIPDAVLESAGARADGLLPSIWDVIHEQETPAGEVFYGDLPGGSSAGAVQYGPSAEDEMFNILTTLI